MFPLYIRPFIYMSLSYICLFYIYFSLFDCFFISILPPYIYSSKYISLCMHISSIYISLHVISLCIFLLLYVFPYYIYFLRIYVTFVYISPLCIYFFLRFLLGFKFLKLKANAIGQ